MLTHLLPDLRQLVGKGHYMLIFGAFSHLAEAGVITVLLATFCVAAHRLNMTIGERANPDIGPGRRNGERLDPLQRLTLGNPRPVRSGIGEACARLLAANAGTVVRDISKSS